MPFCEPPGNSAIAASIACVIAIATSRSTKPCRLVAVIQEVLMNYCAVWPYGHAWAIERVQARRQRLMKSVEMLGPRQSFRRQSRSAGT